jgi:hypothetical protein
VREFPFKRTALCDCDYAVDFSELAEDDSRVALIATKPLTLNEEWVEFERGQLILFDDGIPHLSPEHSLDSELSGHGLDSNYHPSIQPLLALEEDMRRYESKRISQTYTAEGI